MVCLSISLKIFNGCLPQILLGPFLNTLTQIVLWSLKVVIHNKSQAWNHRNWSISNTNMNFNDVICTRAPLLSLYRTEMLNLSSSSIVKTYKKGRHQGKEIWVYTLIINQFDTNITFQYPQKTQVFWRFEGL